MTNEENLTDQLNRKKRVRRLKRGIITVFLVWFVASVVLLIFLFVKVLVLQKQVAVLAENQEEINEFVYEYAKRITESVEETVEPTGASAETDEPSVMMLPDEENLAGPEDVHKVYLTFDDGPSENTDRILDILSEYDVKATFFVIGREDEAAKAALQRIVAEGHTLGMHSFSHKYSTIYNTLRDFKSDFFRIRDFLKETTGEEPVFYRFPGSSANQVSNTEMSEFIRFLNEENVVYFDWNVAGADATTQAYTGEELVDQIVRDVRRYKTSVVLLHDSDAKKVTADALPALIEGLQAEGCQLLPIDRSTKTIQYSVLPEEEQETENNENE